MLETKSIAALAFNDTPRKRKRETGFVPPLKNDAAATDAAAAAVVVNETPVAAATTASCFTNAAFSSTPKKLIGRRRLVIKNIENRNPFVPHPSLEIKSIAADLTVVEDKPENVISTNPFEVMRQPSKKKKRSHACFENPALNLELPERQFNPYEVVRSIATPPRSRCFVNKALNLRGSDVPASLNPFEIHRRSEISAAAGNPHGVENQALGTESLPTTLKIGLPFAPNLGLRIDFTGMELSELTPNKLLAEKLVFSPLTPVTPMTPMTPLPSHRKRAMQAIDEESFMDIAKELDFYQLELENCMNEAKLRQHGILTEETKLEEEEKKEEQQMEKRFACKKMRRRMLTEIREDTVEESMEEVEEIEGEVEEEEDEEEDEEVEEEVAQEVEQDVEEEVEEKVEEPEEEEIKEEVENEPQTEAEPVNNDVVYASESEPEEEPAEAERDEEEEQDFKAPSRFVRSYRPAATVAPPTKVRSLESLHSIASSKSGKSTESAHRHGVSHMIRKSIRKLMHPKHQELKEQEDHQERQEKPSKILSSIRQSLRRKPQKPNATKEKDHEQEPEQEHQKLEHPADISIIDSSERTMKLRTNVLQTEYMRIEQLTNERKHSLRNSIRRSTRDVLRHVFHKSQDCYDTGK